MPNCNCQNIEHIPPAVLRFTSSATITSCKGAAIAIMEKGAELPCDAVLVEGEEVWFFPKRPLMPVNSCSWRTPKSAVEVIQ